MQLYKFLQDEDKDEWKEDSIIWKQFFVRERFCDFVGHVCEKIRQGCFQYWSDLVQE